MGFFIRYTDASNQQHVLSLQPAPSDVEYPEKRLFKKLSTQDNGTIIQRPLRDNRSRKWIWASYRSNIVLYENQYQTIATLEYRARQLAGLTPTVDIWEDASGTGGFDKLDGLGNKIWTTVKFIQVDRKLRQGSAIPTFDQTWIEFVIADSNFSGF